jgi:hypothetical protein
MFDALKAFLAALFAFAWGVMEDAMYAYRQCVREGGDPEECWRKAFSPDELPPSVKDLVRPLFEAIDWPFPPPGPYVPLHENLKVLHLALSKVLASLEAVLPEEK